MASVEVPFGVSFAYGFDYHPVWYTQLKPSAGFGWANSSFIGKSRTLQYALIAEQRYNYNIIKRQSKEKNTLHKSANFLSVKTAYVFTHTKYDKNNPIVQIFEDDKYNEHLYYCTISWGMRRAMGKRFYFDGSIGFGPAYTYTIYSHQWEAVTDLSLSIGFKLF